MSLGIGMVTIDCAEPQQLAAFWSEALGVSIQGDYGDFVFLARPVVGGPRARAAAGRQTIAALTPCRQMFLIR